MREIDAVIDQVPSKKKISSLVELRNRNLLAFEELQHFNDTGTFKYKHPLIIHYSLRAELADMKRKNPDKFLDQFANARDNVKRYRSFLNSAGRSDERKQQDKENLKKHESRVAVFKEVLQED